MQSGIHLFIILFTFYLLKVILNVKLICLLYLYMHVVKLRITSFQNVYKT